MRKGLEKERKKGERRERRGEGEKEGEKERKKGRRRERRGEGEKEGGKAHFNSF